MYDEKQHYHHLYQQADHAFSFARSKNLPFTDWQKAFRKQLKQVLGLEKMEADLAGYSLEATFIKKEAKDGYFLERWIMQVEPMVALPFYMLRPERENAGLSLVLTPHGHNQPGLYVGDSLNLLEKALIKEGDRDIAIQAVKQGCLVIAPTARGFGDTRMEADRLAGKLSSCRTLLVNDLLVGRTPIGDRVWDISRLLDWALQTQPIDPKRVVITGNSGGGTISLFAPACDTRIQIAVPSSYFCTFAGSIGSINHCECNYIPGMLQLGEMYDVAGLIAPRPFCAIAGRFDEIFPIQETELAYNRLKEIYTASGAAEFCQLGIGEGGHRYYKDLAWKFINSHLERINNQDG